MFATLVGPLPPLVDSERPVAERLRATLDAQIEAGLGLLTDGGVHASDPIRLVATALGLVAGPPMEFPASGRSVATLEATAPPRWAGPITVDAWQATASAAGEHLVKATLPGPYTLGRLATGGAARGAGRRALTMALAEGLALEVAALVAAGCPVVQIDEDAAMAIGEDERERGLFRDAHGLLTAAVGADRVDGPHLTLALGWGNADTAGAATFFDAPYRSYLFDLIAGPDNWRLAVQVPGDRGVVCGAIDPRSPGPGDVELLVWAARYAASTQERGMERVGLAPGAGLELVAPEHARLKLRILGEGARLATASRAELREWLDPRALD